ncbi:MAG: TAXI family TRAP transporter solute-binding subunit [Bacillota bacterium]
MKNKGILFLTIVLILITGLLGACASGDKTPDGKKETIDLRFPTASTTGVIYPLGSAMSNLWNGKIDNLRVSVQASNGGVHNLNLLRDKEAEISFATTGIMWEAYHGQGKFENREYKDLRTIAGLYYNPNQFVVREAANINSIADIKGKNFAPGAIGSTPEVESKAILTEYGIKYPDDIKANFVGFTEAIDLMRNNQIDGALIQAGLPTAAVTEMTATAGGKLLSIEPHIRKSLKEKYPWYADFIIPAGTYDKQTTDIETLAIKMMLITDASVSEELIYDLTKNLWENLDEIRSAHPIVEQLDIKEAVTELAGIPLHPGAEKYYREIGLLK